MVPNKKEIDVIGIGNAIVDVLANTSENFLESHSLIKGSMTLINEQKANLLYEQNIHSLQTSGGSAANTISGIAQLGGNASFIGRVKKDNLGNIFTNDICSTGANFDVPPIDKGPSTARCFIYVTPDAERTMCTFLGSSVYLEANDLDISLIKKSKVLYLEGYLWDNEEAKKAFLLAAKVCKNAGGKVALSLSDFLCIERHRESFLDLVENNIDILFANESEIISLYQTETLDAAKEKVKGKCEIAILTLGERGSIITTKDNEYYINPYNLGETIDTTGAGDLYASGFLYGFTSNKDLKTCGEIASICAGHIVTVLGPRTKTSLELLIKENIINF